MTKVFFCRCSHANKKGEREGSSSFIVVVKGYSTILTYYPPLLPLELTLQCSPKKGERSLPIFQYTNTGLAPTTTSLISHKYAHCRQNTILHYK